MTVSHANEENVVLIHTGNDELQDRYIENVLLNLNRENSGTFIKLHDTRDHYRELFPTEIVFMMCIDERLQASFTTDTPIGLIHPIQSGGGEFDLGWQSLNAAVRDLIEYASSKGRHILFVCTYHFSRSEKKWGCAYFKHDTEAAKRSALKLVAQIETTFSNSKVHAICAGIETDEDALVLHNSTGASVDLAHFAGKEEHLLREALSLYPSLPTRAKMDLGEMLKGNLRRITKVRAEKKKAIDFDHRGVGIFVGRGFDWVYKPNFGLVVGYWSPEWPRLLAIAAGIVSKNVKNRTVLEIPADAWPFLMVSASFRSAGTPEERLAVPLAQYLYVTCEQVLGNEFPELWEQLAKVAGTTNLDTREFNKIS